MRTLDMFPLGSVLFPFMPQQLRVFEDRYLLMLSRILRDEPSEYGVVLIERGQEVGGGEQRFSVGTVARIAQLESSEGFVGLLSHGGSRFLVTEWLEDDPHPRATVEVLPELVWAEELRPLRVAAESAVRRALALASEFSDQSWSATVELSDHPVESAWQLAAIAPLGSLDQVTLLSSTSMGQLLATLTDLATDVQDYLRSPWPGEEDD